MTSNEDEPTSGARCPTHPATVRVGGLRDLQQLMRSKAFVLSPDVSAHNYLHPSKLGDINVNEFLDGAVSFANGDEHRVRRKLLNSLVRPEQLVKFREDIALPAARTWISHALAHSERTGATSFDLVEVLEMTFLEFAANAIGLTNVDSEDSMRKLRACVLPIFAGLSASFFEDREGVTRKGLAAKATFVNDYFRPSVDEWRARVERAEADGTVGELPLNLLRLVAAQAHPAYADETLAIKEAILFFVAITGTSTQAVVSTVEDLARWFESHPDDIESLSDTEFVSRALQESLRLKAPYLSHLTRLAVEDTEIGGCPIKAGDEVYVQLPRAGRDRSIFGEDADEFNPRREYPEGVFPYGLAFGTGPHQCLGLRAVLGNDGRSGAHIGVLQLLFEAGIRRDPSAEPTTLRMGEDAEDGIYTYTSYPAQFARWDAVVGHTDHTERSPE